MRDGVLNLIPVLPRKICGKHDQDHAENPQEQNPRPQLTCQFPGQKGSQKEGEYPHDVERRAGKGKPSFS